MLAAMRAELLVLRKWPAAWGLLLVVPVVTLLPYYVISFVTYLTETPAEYARQGSPAMILPSMLPSQFVIVALTLLPSTTTPFIVLGAVMAGGDWERGTIATSLLATAGRVRAAAGQAAALVVAVAASIAVTFASCAAASLLIRALEAHAARPVDAAFPPAWVIVRGLGAGLLIAVAYGCTGLLLGMVCRSAAGGIAAAVLWTALLDPALYELGLNTGSQTLHTITLLFPYSSAVTLAIMFGAPGGGASTSVYLPVAPAVAAWVLAGYAAVFLGLTLLLVRRRDVLTARSPRRRDVLTAWPARRRRRPAPLPASAAGPLPASAAGPLPASAAGPLPASAAGPLPVPAPAATGPPPDRVSGVLGSLRAELLVLRRRPAVWALVLAMPVNMLVISYVTEYVTYLTAGGGTNSEVGASSSQVLPYLLPGQYLTNVLSGFAIYGGVFGPAMFFLLGAVVAGTEWGRRTLVTALLAGPRRVQARIGQDLSVLLAAVAAVIVTFLLAAAVTTALAASLGGSAPPLYTLFPSAAHIAMTAAATLTVALCCTAIGLALGTFLRSATKAAGTVLLWAVIIQPQLNSLSTQLHGTWLRVYEILPSAALNTLVNVGNTTAAYVPGTSLSPPAGVQIIPALAALTLGLYAAASLAAAALITTRRDIT